MSGAGRPDHPVTVDADFLGDYDTLRHRVGAVPVGRDVLRVAGPDAVSFLQGQLSQDVAALAVGESADSLVLSPQGKLDALLRVTRVADDAFVLDVAAGFGDALAARLRRFKLRVKAEIEPLPWRCLALRGPASPPPGPGAAFPGAELALAWRWDGVGGLDLLGEAPEAPTGTPVCGAAAWEALRIEAGIPVMGLELDERTIAAEAGLLERTVSFTKGCYTGQELVARLDARGNRVARHLRGVVVPGESSAPSRGAELVTPGGASAAGPEGGPTTGRVVGEITSSAHSPALGCAVALAYVHRSVEPGTTLGLRLPAGVVEAEVRDLPLVGAV